MKTTKLLMMAAAVVLGLCLISADHIDAPAVNGTTSDIADFYSFESPSNSDNIVLAATLQGLLSPVNTGNSSFEESVLLEFNIDNDGDLVEDLVVQAIPRDGEMFIFGPYAPGTTGLNSTINTNQQSVSVAITDYGEEAVSATNMGITAFAGPRDDPFFFDLGAYSDVLAGNATGFSNPGTDTFAGTNVMAIVVEVPKSTLNATSGTVNMWVETKSMQ